MMNKPWKVFAATSLAVVALAACSGETKDEIEATKDVATEEAKDVKEDVKDGAEQAKESMDEKAEETKEKFDEAKEEAKEERLHTAQGFFGDEGMRHYKGEGNEFAGSEEKVTHIGDDYVLIERNNGGAASRDYYTAKDGIIYLLQTGVIEDENAAILTEEELDGLDRERAIVNVDAKDGETFDHLDDQTFTVEATDATVETPFETFKDAIKLVHEKEENGETVTMTRYYVPGYGLVKEEYEALGDDSSMKVVTELESIDE